jgi:hypothetical protein
MRTVILKSGDRFNITQEEMDRLIYSIENNNNTAENNFQCFDRGKDGKINLLINTTQISAII